MYNLPRSCASTAIPIFDVSQRRMKLTKKRTVAIARISARYGTSRLWSEPTIALSIVRWIRIGISSESPVNTSEHESPIATKRRWPHQSGNRWRSVGQRLRSGGST